MYQVKGKEKRFDIEFTNASGSIGKLNNEGFELDQLHIDEQRMHVLRNGKSYNVEHVGIDTTEKTVTIKVNGNLYTLEVKDRFDLLLEEMGMDNLAAAKVSELKAPMPGLVLSIEVEAGQAVAKGEPLIVLEAMKMENVIKSPEDVVVKTVNVNQGVAVEKNQVLIDFE